MSRSIAKLKNDTKIITSIFRDDFNQIIAVTLFGFLIRFYGLNQNGFSWDELLVLLNAKQPFASINTFTPPPFFTYILHLVYIFGGSDSFFRVLPAAIGAAIVPVLY